VSLVRCAGSGPLHARGAPPPLRPAVGRRPRPARCRPHTASRGAHSCHTPRTACPTPRSITAVTEGLASYILLACHGSGCAHLESNMVMKGADWSPYQLGGGASHLYLSGAGPAHPSSSHSWPAAGPRGPAGSPGLLV
jgi:hypothetical protein